MKLFSGCEGKNSYFETWAGCQLHTAVAVSLEKQVFCAFCVGSLLCPTLGFDILADCLNPESIPGYAAHSHITDWSPTYIA
jgi:hypothetical protein